MKQEDTGKTDRREKKDYVKPTVKSEPVLERQVLGSAEGGNPKGC